MWHLFHLLLVGSLCMSYCVTDGDEPAKAPATKKKEAKLSGSSLGVKPACCLVGSMPTPSSSGSLGTSRRSHCQAQGILDRISDSIFWGPTQRLFFPSREPTSLRTFPTHWFPRLKQVRESESRMYVAQLLASACVHAHCGAHACSVPQEERKSQCTICQSCNLKLPRRCQSNTQFCALRRFGRQTWTWESACAYGLFATL